MLRHLPIEGGPLAGGLEVILPEPVVEGAVACSRLKA